MQNKLTNCIMNSNLELKFTFKFEGFLKLNVEYLVKYSVRFVWIQDDNYDWSVSDCEQAEDKQMLVYRCQCLLGAHSVNCRNWGYSHKKYKVENKVKCETLTSHAECCWAHSVCGAWSVSYPQPRWQIKHKCTVGTDWDPPVWCSHPDKMMRTPKRQLLRAVWVLACRTAHVDTSVGRGVVVLCCLTSVLLLERRSIDLGQLGHSTCSSSLQTHSPPACTRDVEHASSSISYCSNRTFHSSRTRLTCTASLTCITRLIRGTRLWVSSSGNPRAPSLQLYSSCDVRSHLSSMRKLVDLARPILHVVERFLVRHIKDFDDDVVCSLASVEHGPRDLELKRVVQHCRGLVDVVADSNRARGVRAEFHTLPTSSGERFSCPDFWHVGLDTVAFSIAGSHNGLIILLTSHCAGWLGHCLRALPEDTLLLGEWIRALACGHNAVSVVIADVGTRR